MTQKYGKTWWGQQWLNALQNIDYSNRLPRGRNYAGKGAVLSVDINKNEIKARVQGSRPSPYKVSMKVPEFSQTEKQKLLEVISGNKMMLSKLLNRQLPASLLSIAQSHNIQVFPRTWNDIEMNCSCPDWAVPCKHLAAVVYGIANQIDENPFLVFQLHDFDLLQLMANRGVDVQKHTLEEILHVNDLYTHEEGEKHENSPDEIPDHSLLPGMRDFLRTILTPSPLFYDKDFRDIMDKAMGKVSLFAQKFEIIPDLVNPEKISPGASASLLFDKKNCDAMVIIIGSDGRKYKPISIIDFFHLSGQLSRDNRLMLFDPSFALLYDILRFVQLLCGHSAIIPQLLQLDNFVYSIRWIPARVENIVKEQCGYFERQLSQTQIFIPSKTEKTTLKNDEQLSLICTLLVREFFAKSFDFGTFSIPGNWLVHPLLSLFFSNETIEFGNKKQNTPNTIQLWLKRLDLVKREMTPIIRIDDEGMGFRMSLDVEMKKQEKVVSLYEFMEDERFATLHLSLLKDLAQLADYLPELESILDTKGTIMFSHLDFENILLRIFPVIRLLGISIALPSSLKYLMRPVAGLKVKEKEKTVSLSFMSLTDMLDYDWGVAIGDTLMDAGKFFELVQGKRGLIKLRDSYILLSDADLEKLQKQLYRRDELTSMELLKATLAEEHENSPVLISEEIKKHISQMLTPEKLDVPAEIVATLRPYQVSGFQWLVANSKLGLGSLIADDMGMGKTLQVIAAFQHFKNAGMISEKRKALVIAPTSLLSNWQKELEKFAPGLNVAIYHGLQRKLPENGFDILLTSYGLARNDNDVLAKNKWYILVIDESQAIKNPSTEQSKAIKKIKAEVRIAMSGTPVENRLSDYWSIFDFINKGYLGNLKAFQDYFAVPIQKEHDRRKAEIFRKVTRPFLLRRLKTDKSIINDLPDKIENTLYCNLTPEQAAIYENVVQSTMETIDKSEGIERKGLVLKLMTALKQICNHPAHYLKKGDKNATLSGKAQMMLSLVENIISNNEKTLIFTQYREMGNLLVEMIRENTGLTPLFLHGGLTRTQRDWQVDEFQNKPHQKIFILSLKAGGTGLNLTAASNVIHYDLWWNPAVEAQATDRAYRIGQNKNVMVYRALCKGTLEERINEMLKSKKELADMTLGTGEAWIGELSNDELRELVKLNR